MGENKRRKDRDEKSKEMYSYVNPLGLICHLPAMIHHVFKLLFSRKESVMKFALVSKVI